MVSHKIVEEGGKKFVEVLVRKEIGTDASATFLSWENELAADLEQARCLATSAAAKCFDTHGEPLCDSLGTTWTSKGLVEAIYHTPGGTITLDRHIYQTSNGGKTRCPLEERIGIIRSSTPRLAKVLSSKIAELPAPAVRRDLMENHSLTLSDSYCQDVAEAVEQRADSVCNLGKWTPDTRSDDVCLLVVGVDGAMVNIRKEGWRQALCGTFTLYDRRGNRLETIYLAHGPGLTPPEGKTVFFKKMDSILEKLKALYPHAVLLGISDAAADFEAWLKARTKEWLVDYHHAAEYITSASAAFDDFVDAEGSGAAHFATTRRHLLLEKHGGVDRLLEELNSRREKRGNDLSATAREGLEKAITYFTNHRTHMDYARWTTLERPIGSGPTEAACKTIIKHRMTQSGMRWGIEGADQIVSLRALFKSETRWQAFWKTHMAVAAVTAL